MSYKHRHITLPKGMGLKNDSSAAKCIPIVCGKQAGDPKNVAQNNAEKKTSGYVDNTDKRCP